LPAYGIGCIKNAEFLIVQLDIVEFLEQSSGYLLLDVRSEGEFAHAHIPGALNLPLFSNSERAEVGTLYKQKGKNDAIQRGLELVGPKMAGFTAFVAERITDNKVFVHCWRGGMRSGSMAWLLNLMGWQVYTLKGGYKSFRGEVQRKLEQAANFVVLAGRTGCGKTDILHALRQQGEQVIDLEGLAHHKGSAFGALGQESQPSSEMFENMLYLQLKEMDYSRNIWLENESKAIGTVYMNHAFWLGISKAPVYIVEADIETRIEKLTQEYGAFDTALLIDAVEKIEKRLGGVNCKEAVMAIEEGNIRRAVEITLVYYDKAYGKSEDMKEREIKRSIVLDGMDTQKAAIELIKSELKK
jgi:tRNA 2-selenouridine synthase